MKRYLAGVLWLLIFTLTSLQSPQERNLKLVVKGIKNVNGEININLYDHADGFPTDQKKAIRHVRGQVSDGRCVVVFKNLPFGKYAIAVYHDENNDNKLNKSWYGRPTEGVGTSNNARGHFGPPAFDQAVFDFSAQSTEQFITISYAFTQSIN